MTRNIAHMCLISLAMSAVGCGGFDVTSGSEARPPEGGEVLI